jgi:hypothetical protein
VRGRCVHQIWKADPAIYAPPRSRRACAYDAFIPAPVTNLDLSLPGDVAGVVSDAEKAIADLNRGAGNRACAARSPAPPHRVHRIVNGRRDVTGCSKPCSVRGQPRDRTEGRLERGRDPRQRSRDATLD